MKRFVGFLLLASVAALCVVPSRAVDTPSANSTTAQPQASSQASSHDRRNHRNTIGKRHHHHHRGTVKH